jgi:hypothetical protein
VVEAAIVPVRSVVGAALALSAVGVLAAMVASGHLRESRQLVRASAAGIMAEEPRRVDRVEIQTSAGRWRFDRGREGWRAAGSGAPGWPSLASHPGGPVAPSLERHLGGPVAPSLALHLDDALKFLHVSAPVRVMGRAEWAPVGLGEFGLDPPGYTAALYGGDARLIAVAFGSVNPQKVLQYAKVQDREELYLLSRFVGAEWEQVLREASGGG